MSTTRNYIVHIHFRTGWHTAKARGRSFGEAAKAAVIVELKKRKLDLDTIPHRVSFKQYPTYAAVHFYETSVRSVFPNWLFAPNGLTTPGQHWFREEVREGNRGDCTHCGGTGQCHYNPFVQCHFCGEKNKDGTQKTFDLIEVNGHLVRADAPQRVIRALKRQRRAA